jgi:predicted MFS family arabinose efflux permease
MMKLTLTAVSFFLISNSILAQVVDPTKKGQSEGFSFTSLAIGIVLGIAIGYFIGKNNSKN